MSDLVRVHEAVDASCALQGLARGADALQSGSGASNAVRVAAGTAVGARAKACRALVRVGGASSASSCVCKKRRKEMWGEWQKKSDVMFF